MREAMGEAMREAMREAMGEVRRRDTRKHVTMKGCLLNKQHIPRISLFAYSLSPTLSLSLIHASSYTST